LKNIETMHVTVEDPQNQGEGRNKHTSYCIRIQPDDDDSTDDNVAVTSSSVRRRYSDFQWIYHRLTDEQPGFFVPVIQHERALRRSKKFDESFVEERRRQLELFLQKLVRHPELKEMACLSLFLMADIDQFEEFKKKKLSSCEGMHDPVVSDVTNSGASGGGDMGSTSERESLTDSDYLEGGEISGPSMTSSVTSDGGNGTRSKGAGIWRQKLRNRVQTAATAVKVRARSGGSLRLERTTDEHTFDDITHYIRDVKLLVNSMAQHVSNLTERDRDVAEGMQDMSKNIFHFVRTQSSKNHDSTFVAMLGEVGVESGHLAEMYDKIGKKQSAKLDDPMQDLVLKVESAEKAMEKRAEWRLKYTSKQQLIKSRKAALDKQFEKNNANANRMMNARLSLTEAEREADAVKRYLNAVSKRILKEMERFKIDLERDVRNVLADNARLHVEHGQKVAEEWENILPMVVLPSDDDENAEGGNLAEVEERSEEEDYCSGDNNDGSVESSSTPPLLPESNGNDPPPDFLS